MAKRKAPAEHPPEPLPITDEQVQAELAKTFDHHPPSAHVAEIYEAWRAMTKSFAANLLGLPPTRERAMALTRLEECGFWLQACIARNHDQFVEPAPPDEPKEE